MTSYHYNYYHRDTVCTKRYAKQKFTVTHNFTNRLSGSEKEWLTCPCLITNTLFFNAVSPLPRPALVSLDAKDVAISHAPIYLIPSTPSTRAQLIEYSSSSHATARAALP